LCFLRRLFIAAHAHGVDEGQRTVGFETQPLRPPVQRGCRARYPASAVIGGE
jgi:hypothetical protein